MPYGSKIRGSIKARSMKKRKGWPSKTRSYPWRSGSSRPAEALMGLRTGRSKPASVHRFTRWGGTYVMEVYDAGGGVAAVRIKSDGATASDPIEVGNLTTTSFTTGASFAGAMQFRLGDLPSVGDFTSLFDHYAIEQVDIEFDSLQNSAQVGAATTPVETIPSIVYCPDFDDATLPADAAELAEYQRAKTWTFRGSGKPLKISLKPRTALTVFRSGVTNAYSAGPEGNAVNVSYTDVPHYGLKFWVDNMPAPTIGAATLAGIRFKVKYHLKFLDPK